MSILKYFKRKKVEEPIEEIVEEIVEDIGHVTIKALIVEPNGKIKIELDWDTKFINHLKANGYTGPGDDAIIQKYILELTNQITESMEDQQYE